MNKPTHGVQLRAYDALGAFRQQLWAVTLADNNSAPILFPVADQTIEEGQSLVLEIGAIDPNGDPLVIWTDHLPPGAIYDPETSQLQFTANGTSAGVSWLVSI